MSRADVLVSADWAEKNLDTPGVVFVEVDEDTSAYAGGHIPGAVDFALSQASPETKVIEDEKLWHDWLAFLAGAAENGGVAVQ